MISGDYGTLGLLVSDSATIKGQLDTLTAQAASGRVADTVGALGTATQTSLDLRPQIAHLQAKQTAIGAATGPMGVTQAAMTRIASIMSDFNASLAGENDVTPGQVDSIATSAKSALTEVASLLDSTDGSTYVFAGADSANPPVPNPDAITSSAFYTQIGAAVGGLAANGAAATASATLAVAASNAAGTTPFSAALSGSGASQAAQLNLGDGTAVQVGLLANRNTLATSGGTSTTGSFMRDLLRGLATMANLSSSQAGAAGFTALVQDTRTSLANATTALGQEAGALGDTQSRLAAMQTQSADASTALTLQVSAVEDVDPATTLTQLSQVQTQLTASYKLIAGLKGMSLADYI